MKTSSLSSASSGGKARPESAPATSPVAWAETSGAPYGVPVRVRDASGQEAIAIRDPYVLWFDENRSAALPFTPTEWRAL